MLVKKSYNKNKGQISKTYLTAGDYGSFINCCRLEAWQYAINKHNIQLKEIVDIGCSNGSWSKNYKFLGFDKLIGIDVNEQVIPEASKHFDEAFVGTTKKLKDINATNQTIAANGVLIHLLKEKEVQEFISDVSDVMDNGSTFLFSVVNSDYYVSPNGFKPWQGPISCTRKLDVYDRLLERAKLNIAEKVGTFINPWFCDKTVFIANDNEIKSDVRLYESFNLLSQSLRGRTIHPFSEVLYVVKK